MIHESMIDHALNRLHAHFGRRVVVRPPASALQLAELEAVIGQLPRDLTILLTTCDGLRVHLEPPHSQECLCCIHELQAAVRDTPCPATFAGLIPVRGDPNGQRDWLAVDRGPAYGRVIRWNQWTPDATLLASCLGTYVAAWVDHLIASFDHQGRLRLDRRPASFDAQFVRERDEEQVRIAATGELIAWLQNLAMAIPSGADFE